MIMRKRLIPLVVVACVFTALLSNADPNEVNPPAPHTVVIARWGEGPDEFAWGGEDWGRHEQTSFGPFVLDAAGCIYLTDLLRNDVKVFTPDGRFDQAVPLLKENNLVYDLAAYDGRIYWIGAIPAVLWDPKTGERLDRSMMVLSVGPGDTEPTVHEVTRDPTLTTNESGRRVHYNCRLALNSDGIDLLAKRTGERFPLVRAGKALTAAEQDAGKEGGIALLWKRTPTLSGGEAGRGDIVELDADGRVRRVIVHAYDAEAILDANEGYILLSRIMSVGDEEHSYLVLRDIDGHMLSVTRRKSRYKDRSLNVHQP